MKATREPETQTKPFEFPEQLAVARDITSAVANEPPAKRLPWAEAPGFDAVYEKLARILYRGRLQHVALVAERGVDPESFLTEFARRSCGDWLPFLQSRRLVLIDARFTTPEQSRDRLLAILGAVASDPELIVAIAGFASLLRAERGSHRDLLLAVLGEVQCQLVGLLTPSEYEEAMGGDAEVEEFFQRVDLPEPPAETAIAVLEDFAAVLKERFDVQFDDQIVRLAVNLSANYILSERLPGKARRILRRVCQDAHFDRTQLGGPRRQIEENDIIQCVAAASGVAPDTLRGIAEKRDYEQSLKEFIIGQDHAVREVATELGLIKAGLSDPGKPASVMLFVGQTGTGKTELAKALARFYSAGKKLRTYTLGNMVEPHSVSSIIGVPPGYVGHDRGGKIVHDLNSDPHCVVLLDEADKAHPDVLQPFLNLFDEGWVRDQRGAQAYADKAIFILTTNVGQRMISDMAKQGKTPDEMAARMKESLARMKHPKLNRPVFAPEFLARIKRVIVFQPLGAEAMLGICRKLISESKAHWAEHRNKKLLVEEDIVMAIAQQSHQRNDKAEGKEGGRIVRKLISEHVDAPIQRAISDDPNRYLQCQTVRVVKQSTEGALALADADGQPASEQIFVRVAFE